MEPKLFALTTFSQFNELELFSSYYLHTTFSFPLYVYTEAALYYTEFTYHAPQSFLSKSNMSIDSIQDIN